MPIQLELSPRKILLALLLVIGMLVIASTIAGAAWYFLDLGEGGFRLVQLFRVDSEANLPSLYAFATLLTSAALLMVIARMERRAGGRYSTHWKAMALVFLYLAFDEGASIHERTVEPVRWLLQKTPIPSSAFLEVGPAWIVLGGLFVLVFVLSYLKFLLHLPARIRNLMILSGLIFVTGALGFEILSHGHAVVHGQENALYAMLAKMEESLEMLGIALFIYTLLLHIRSIAPQFEVAIGRP